MQVGRNLLESEIVLFVAVRAANQVEMLAFSLLRREPRLRMAPGKQGERANEQHHGCDDTCAIAFWFHGFSRRPANLAAVPRSEVRMPPPAGKRRRYQSFSWRRERRRGAHRILRLDSSRE